MSLTGFLFGNVDEEGRLSDSELDDELRNTLGGEEASEYLTGVLGSSLFNDAPDKKPQTDAPTRGDSVSAMQASTAPTPATGSPTIKPNADAVDFSDFNELADDAAVPMRWRENLPMPAMRLKHSTAVLRADVDDDYDSDEDGEPTTGATSMDADIKAEAAGQAVNPPFGVATDETTGSVLAILPASAPGAASKGDVGDSDYDQNTLLENDEEILEDLFDSPTKSAPGTAGKDAVHSMLVPAGGDEQQADQPPKVPVLSEESKESKDVTQALVPRAVKRIPSGPLQFTDYFGCQIIRHIKKPRRTRLAERLQQEQADGDGLQQIALKQQPALDTRRVLASNHSVERQEPFLHSVLAKSIAADENTDVYVTIDADTGAVTSQTMAPKKPADTPAQLFRKMPYPLDLEDWEKSIIWQGDDGGDNSKSSSSSSDKGACRLEAEDIFSQPRNSLIEDYESHIIWDTETPFQPCTQLQINMNDMHMLFEDANSIKESNAREAERLRLLEGVDRFNLSNDHFYEALQEGKVHRVRQTFGQLIIAHSLPSLRLQPPYFKMRHTRADLKAWHRPCLQVPINAPIQFSRARSAKKKKQKHSMENPWAAKDITLKDTADSILIEYSEEYPLVLSNVGMGSVFVNYYRKRGIQDRSFPKVDLGELFILDVADISPFLNFGNIEPGQVIPALYNNMFRAPLFSQRVRKTDFLVVKHVAKGESKWYARSIKYQYIAGQTYPLQEVPAPHSRKVTTTIKHRLQVAAYRLMNRNQYHLLQMAKLSRLFPEYSDLQIRQRLKEFCEYQRKGLGAGYWRPKHNMPIPDEENLRKMLTPEMLCLFESMRVGQQQLHDAGKLGEEEEDNADESGESKLSIEELLAAWNLTRNFINATQGKAMLKLYGEGDPTGKGEGFSFVRVSMKDIFLRAGESVEEKLAEIEARPKSAHRYNVAEQQQIYKEEISCIWNKQFKSLTQEAPVEEDVSEAYQDENIIVPEVNDMFGDSTTGQGISAISPAHMVPGSAMDVSQKLARGSGNHHHQQLATAHANFIQPNRKGLVVRRAVKSPYTGELMWRSEVIKDSAIIQAYLRQRRIIENLAYEREDLFDGDDMGSGPGSMADLAGETQMHLNRLKKARERRVVDSREHEKSHMTTFSLPQPNKPKKEVIRRCGNCGQLGHMKTNKKCPRYFEFNPV
ncbi:hypothetical protein GQ54DRAFT_298684 [Martensiomyces pterosporus]|nr:hypothetical protein GQ54DRAFT_298684 [Martensiomyces pterosporus]